MLPRVKVQTGRAMIVLSFIHQTFAPFQPFFSKHQWHEDKVLKGPFPERWSSLTTLASKQSTVTSGLLTELNVFIIQNFLKISTNMSFCFCIGGEDWPTTKTCCFCLTEKKWWQTCFCEQVQLSSLGSHGSLFQSHLLSLPFWICLP